MPVPKASLLRPGIPVNVILKPDQRSGKLTTGSISEILTRGNHPRGIKVRLADGRVGRVQSLAWGSSGAGASVQGDDNGEDRLGARRYDFRSGEVLQQNGAMPESRTLADYMKAPRTSKRRNGTQELGVEETLQERMEKQFPRIDTALIAAIIADHDDVNAAKNVLSSL